MREKKSLINKTVVNGDNWDDENRLTGSGGWVLLKNVLNRYYA